MKLAMTPRALAVAKRVTAHRAMKSTSGLRIARRRGMDALHVASVPEPHPDDLTVERDGARLYVGPRAARRVHDRELDARTEPGGRVVFVLRGAT